MLHDIGKIGLPDAILQKPGKLGASSWEVRTHPEIGAQVLSGRGLEDLRSWVLAHHERPDGLGYPAGVSDKAIPIEAKILAVADAFEAMTTDRVYRAGVAAEPLGGAAALRGHAVRRTRGRGLHGRAGRARARGRRARAERGRNSRGR